LNLFLTELVKSLKPIATPTDCDVMENVFSSKNVYIKSFCIENFARNYETSRINCFRRGMQLFRADSPEAIAVVLDAANKRWTSKYWYVILHIYENATGPLFVSNVNPSGMCEITTGNKTAVKRCACEYIDEKRKLNFNVVE
jgi:hypothetical protein